MLIFIKLAWRNILRNKKRTIITATAIGLGLASLIYMDALMTGMEENMIDSATSSFMGEAQIHAKGFRLTQEVENVIAGSDRVFAGLDSESVVEYYAPRTVTFGMITSPDNVASVSFTGVDPEKEKNISKIDDAIIEGEFFKGDNPRDIVIGSKLAELLDAQLGDRVVITVSQAGTGDLSQELFKVSGIFRFNIDEMDKGAVFVRISKARQMLALEGGIHEIAVKFKEQSYAVDQTLPFWHKYSGADNEALSWAELMPQLKSIFGLIDFNIWIVAFILFGIVALGIINTLFMSLFERMFEFGVLKAVGTRARQVFMLIVFEAGCLGVVSGIFGIIIGFVMTYIYSKIGINYTGIEFAGVTFREPIYTVLKAHQFLIYPAAIFAFTIISSLYPAIYAARMSAVKAMRRTL